MTRKILALALLLFASLAFARTRSVSGGSASAHPEISPLGAGASINGIIDSINGNIITLADGLITIDATGAKVAAGRGNDGTLADLEPGMLLFATLKTHDVAANAPLAAVMIHAVPIPDATLFGVVQSVDAGAKTFELLGRTIHVTPDTSFGGFIKNSDVQPGINDLLPEQLAQAQVDVIGGKLVATTVLVVAPRLPVVKHARGAVREIGSDTWIVGDLTLIVNAQTKIIGTPKVGDTVEVLYTVNSAHENVAISIAKFTEPDPPNNQNFLFHGTVKTISDQSWVITVSAEREVKVAISRLTKIDSGIVVGDHVEVIAIGEGDKLTAILILKKK